MLDYENLSNNGISAEELANIFLKDYYGNNISFPIDPFRVLKDLNILFIFRPFKKYEGVYIPCVDNDDKLYKFYQSFYLPILKKISSAHFV